MHFDDYISDLLYRYECVILPDFGAFLTQNISAKVHDSTHAFYPPKKILSFNAQLKTNDGLLANYIASHEKIPYQVAQVKLLKKIKALKFSLEQGKTISFKHIGNIKLNDTQQLIFEPSYHINYLTAAFGLAQFVSPKIDREVHKTIVKDLEERVPITITPEKRKIAPSLYKYAAVAVLALSLGGFLTANFYNNKVETHNLIAQEEANKSIDAQVQEATFLIDNPLSAITLNVTKQIGNYHIVGGAFRIKSNCDKKLKELLDLGFKARAIGVNVNGLHQVVYGSYSTREDAQNALFAIRKQHNPEAWLLIKSLD